MVHRLTIPLLALVAVLHAIELGIYRPMPSWVAFYGMFGERLPNVTMAVLLGAGATMVVIGRYAAPTRRELSRTGKELIAAGFALNAVGRVGWILWHVLGGDVPNPPAAIDVSLLTLTMYASLYALVAALAFCMARLGGADRE